MIEQIIQVPSNEIYATGGDYSKQFDIRSWFKIKPVGASPVDNFFGKVVGSMGF